MIEQAFAAQAPAAHAKGVHPARHDFSPGQDPSTELTARLKAANVTAAQADAIAADMKTFETTLKTLDPALQAKISADRAALAKDFGTGLHVRPAGHPDRAPLH